ncbi:MAG: hypothetical protein AB8A49_09365 [Prochlorococcus sp.]|jgi:hypothetical protein
MNQVNEQSSKDEIIEASLEYISYIEAMTYTAGQVWSMAIIALLVGFFAGLSI